MCDWASKFELKFSFDKCQHLQIGYNNSNISYNLGSHKISSCELVVDLGVTIQPSLKSSLYCSQVAKKANIRAKLILKSFLSRNSINYIRAIKFYVRFVLEYASVIWNPNLLQDINLIENVPRRFTSNVCNLCNIPTLSYDERLALFGLERLELRRLKFDLTELFKIVNGFTTCRLYDYFQFAQTNSMHYTRGHRYKLYIIRTCKNSFKYYFINRIAHIWNCLPDNYFNTQVIGSFRAKLSAFDFTKYLPGQP